MDLLQSAPHNYKLKGVGDPRYHLGGDFFRDPDGCLCYSAQTYVKRLIVNYTQMFGEPPKSYMSPLAKGDHPELDLTELSGPADVPLAQVPLEEDPLLDCRRRSTSNHETQRSPHTRIHGRGFQCRNR